MARWVVVCLLVGSPILPPRSAEACMNEVEREINPQTIFLVRAERALERGKLERAGVLVLRAFPKIRTSLPARAAHLRNKALFLAAVISVRSEGRLSLARVREEQRVNLRWAVDTLRALHQLRSTPALQTVLGEGLAQVPGGEKEALTVLSGLASRDLLTSARGYAALARLYAAAGQPRESAAAVQRCLAWSKGAERAQCAIPKAKVASAR